MALHQLDETVESPAIDMSVVRPFPLVLQTVISLIACSIFGMCSKVSVETTSVATFDGLGMPVADASKILVFPPFANTLRK